MPLTLTRTEPGNKSGASKVVIAISLARMADALGNSILTVIIPLYVVHLANPDQDIPPSVLIGILISAYGFVIAFFQAPMGALVDRFPRRKLFIQVGLVLMAVGTLAFVFAQNFTHLIIIRSIQGIGVAITIPAMLALLASETKTETRGGAMGIYTTMRIIGFAAGPLVGGFIEINYGFNTAFIAGSVMVFISALFIQVWVKETTEAANTIDPGKFKLLDPQVFTPQLISLGLATSLMASAMSILSPLENEINARLGQNSLGFGIAFSALLVSRFFTQVPLGRLSDRIGRKPVIIVGLIALAPTTALLGLASTTTQLTLVRLFQGIATAAIAAPLFALAGDLSKRGGEGRQMSVVTIGWGFGLAIGPLLAGYLVIIRYELPFLVGGLMALMGAWIIQRYAPETVHSGSASQQASSAIATSED